MLTPREFAALESVYYGTIERWGFERAHQATLHGVKHPAGRPLAVSDFVSTPKGREASAKADRDRVALAAARVAEAQELAAMRSGHFDEADLPIWAQMTEEEKRGRVRG